MKSFLLERKSAVFLVASNLFPIFGILFLNWSLAPVIFLYWLESGIIGFFNILKMAVASSKGRGFERIGAFFSIPFFVVHYSVFMSAHLIFLLIFFGLSMDFGGVAEILVGAVFLFASHASSFSSNFIGGREYAGKTPFDFIFSPYKRIVVMHLTIIFGAFMMFAFQGAQKPFGVLLVILKTLADLFSHLSSHRRGGPEGAEAPDGPKTVFGEKSS